MSKPLVKSGSPRSAIVTGAGRGIGRAIAAELVGRGYDVVVTDLDPAAAELAAKEIGARLGLGLDVTDPEANRDIAARACEIAPLGAWVCNAGVLFEGPMTGQSVDQVRLMVEVNVLGAMWGIRAAADTFRDQAGGGVKGGEIGILASLSAHAPVPGLAVYAATKAAVLSLTTSLASELRKDKIRIHAVCPDGVDTKMVGDMDAHGDVRAALAAGVLLTPAQVARELVDMFGTRRIYKTLPPWRGALARAGSFAPGVFMRADPVLRRVGARRLKKAGIL